MRRASKLLLAVTLAFIAGASWAPSAFAVGVAAPNVLDAAKDSEDVRVTVNGVSSNIVFVQQCWRNGDDPKFDLTRDCSQFNAINPVVVGGRAEGVIAVFNGDDPNLGEWSCGTNGSAGVPNSAACFLRVAPESVDNVTADEFITITWSATPPPAPSTLPPSTVPGFSTTVAGGSPTTAPTSSATTGPGGSETTTTAAGSAGNGGAGLGTTTIAGGAGGSVTTDATGGAATLVGGVDSSTTLVGDSATAPGKGSDTPWVAIVVAVVVLAALAGYLGFRSSRRRPAP